jgi:hypothetical protein
MYEYSDYMIIKSIYDNLIIYARFLLMDRYMNTTENQKYMCIMCNFYASNSELLIIPSKLLDEDVINYIKIHKESDPYSNDIDYTSFLTDFFKN